MSEQPQNSIFARIAGHVGGKVITAVLVLAVVIAGIWFWRHPDDAAAVWQAIKHALIWIGFAGVLPWALFFLPSMVLKTESNAMGALLLIGYLAADFLMAWWLAEWDIEGTLSWAVVVVGLLAAGLYNFVVCDQLAEWSEDRAC